MKIFCIGFPKSATKTLTRAFSSTGMAAFHQNTTDGQNVATALVSGNRDKDNPFYYLNQRFQSFAITEADYTNFDRGIVEWPQLDYLLLRNALFHNPNSIMILNYRNPESLLDSFTRWKDGDFRDRVTRADLPGLPTGVGDKEQDMLDWFERHFMACRAMFRIYRTRFIEVDIESPDFQSKLEHFLDIRFNWWGVENANP